MLVIYTHIAKHHQKLKKKTQLEVKMYSEKPNENKILCTEIVCVLFLYKPSSALNESSFVAKTKFFCQQKVWVLFLYKQPSSCVGLFSTLSFMGRRMFFGEITDDVKNPELRGFTVYCIMT